MIDSFLDYLMTLYQLHTVPKIRVILKDNL